MALRSIDIIGATLTTVGAAILAWKTITDTPAGDTAPDTATVDECPARKARAATQTRSTRRTSDVRRQSFGDIKDIRSHEQMGNGAVKRSAATQSGRNALDSSGGMER